MLIDAFPNLTRRTCELLLGRLLRGVFIALLLLTVSSAQKAFAQEVPPAPYMPATPQQVLADIGAPPDVQSVVQGGWGYGKLDVMVIKNPYKHKNKFFDIRAFEADLIDMRNMEEFYTVPPDDERFFPLKCLILKQSEQVDASGRRYDIAEAEIDLLPEAYWPELEEMDRQNATDEQILAFFSGKIVRLNRLFWFDITEPYTDNKAIFE